MTGPIDPAIGAVHIDLHFESSKADVWEMIVDPAKLSAWLGGPCSIGHEVGADVVFDLEADNMHATGTVRKFHPPREGYSVATVSHTFVDRDRPDMRSECSWAVVDSLGGGCDLHFRQDGFGELHGDGFARVWTRRLGVAAAGPAAPASRSTTLDEAKQVLTASPVILLVSFIGPEVPRTLLHAGFDVFAKVGPADDDWAHGRLDDEGEPVFDRTGAPPDHVDLVHLDWGLDFPDFVAMAAGLGAHTLWFHSARTKPPEPADNRGTWVPAPQSHQQRLIAERRGLRYIDDHYIADVARSLQR